jgi:hypothetical protein
VNETANRGGWDHKVGGNVTIFVDFGAGIAENSRGVRVLQAPMTPLTIQPEKEAEVATTRSYRTLSLSPNESGARSEQGAR